MFFFYFFSCWWVLLSMAWIFILTFSYFFRDSRCWVDSISNLINEDRNFESLKWSLMFFGPFVNERVEPILDHMLIPAADESGDEWPLLPIMLIEFKHLNILLRSPFSLLDIGIDMVDPPLPTLMRSSGDHFIGEHPIGDEFPVDRFIITWHSSLPFVDLSLNHSIFSNSPISFGAAYMWED